MRQYVIKRLLLFVPVVVMVSVIIFAIMRIVPGDIAEVILAGAEGEGRYTQEDYDRLRHRLGLDKPLPVQYIDWVTGVVRLDLGQSLITGEPVLQDLARRFPLTVELAFFTLIVSLLIAIPAGIVSAVRQDTVVDYVVRTVAIGGLSMPTFWTGSLIIIALVLFFAWTPPIGYVPLLEDPIINLQQLLFPALALGYFYGAVISRMTRSAMIEVLRQDYVRTARAKGLREFVVVSRHALKNATLPIVTISAFQFGHLLGGTIIMEALFVLPGMGTALIQSINYRDYPVIQAIIVLIAFIFLLVNFLVDIVYGWLDPRVRYA